MGLASADMVPTVIPEPLALAVKRAVQLGKVICLPVLPAQLYVARCFYPGATESVIDADFLYLWEPYFRIHGNDPCDLDLPSQR